MSYNDTPFIDRKDRIMSKLSPMQKSLIGIAINVTIKVVAYFAFQRFLTAEIEKIRQNHPNDPFFN